MKRIRFQPKNMKISFKVEVILRLVYLEKNKLSEKSKRPHNKMILLFSRKIVGRNAENWIHFKIVKGKFNKNKAEFT